MSLPHLSPSQVSMFLTCGLRWQHSYVDGWKSPKTGPLVRGIALDETCSLHYRERSKGLPGLDQAEFVESCIAHHNHQVEEDDVELDYPEDQSKAMLTRAAGAYWREVGQKLHPRSYQDVQRKFVAQVDGFEVWGIVDLVTDSGAVIDQKLKGRAPSRDDLDNNLQLSTYAWLTGAQNLALAVAQPNGTASLLWTTRTEDEIERIKRLYHRVWTCIQLGVTVPASPESWACGPKWCQFWKRCELGGGK